mgnify:CR=1 FL=1
MKIILCLGVMAILATACNSTENKTLSPASVSSEAIAGEKYAAAVNSGQQTDTMKASVVRVTTQSVADNNISVAYHSPGVRGRIIWGGLVPYNQVWVTGAHSATRISFTKDVEIGGKHIAAGTYAIFSIPGKDKWTFILNKNYEQHLADDYKQAEDLLRMDITPEILTDTVQRLTYEIKSASHNTGDIIVSWEKLKFTVPFTMLQQTSGTHRMSTQKTLTGIKTDSKRDPVCFMPVTAGITDTAFYKGKVYGFCSGECKRLFLESPASYLSKKE